MNGKTLIITLSTLILTVSVCTCPAAPQLPEGLLRDGHGIRTVQGKVIAGPEEGVWLFELAEDVNDLACVVKAGTKLQLLPSIMLEKLIGNLASHQDATYLLTGSVTQYKESNFIYPTFFRGIIVVSEQPEPAPQVEQEPVKQAEPNKPVEQPKVEQTPVQEKTPTPAVTDANNLLELPQEVLDRINSRKITRTPNPPRLVVPTIPEAPKPKDKPSAEQPQVKPVKQAESTAASSQGFDSILADRMGRLSQRDDGGFEFVLDAYGLSAKSVTLRLLPCQALELTEDKIAASPERSTFKIAGIRTKYKGEDYILLQRAVRIFSHGNFRAFTPQYR